MSDVVKSELYEAELEIYKGRYDPGARSIYEWLKMRRDELNAKWMGLAGVDLVSAQGEARGIARLIKLIEQGPKVQPERKIT